MSLEKKLDGKQVTKIVSDYFVETYGGPYGVIQFEVLRVEYDEGEKVWTVECSFYRSMVAPEKDFYQVVINSDCSIASVRKIERQSRQG